MWEMVFQSEELQNMCRCVEDTNHFETFEGRRRAGVAGAFLGTFWEPAERSWVPLGRLLDSSWSQKVETEIAFESNLGFCREFLAAPVDAKACGRVSGNGATIFAAFGDSVSERGASEPVAECPTGTH